MLSLNYCHHHVLCSFDARNWTENQSNTATTERTWLFTFLQHSKMFFPNLSFVISTLLSLWRERNFFPLNEFHILHFLQHCKTTFTDDHHTCTVYSELKTCWDKNIVWRKRRNCSETFFTFMYSSSVCGLSILGVPFTAVLHPSLCLSVRNAIDQNRVREQRRSLFVRAVSTWKINSMCVCVREIEGERERAIVRS